MTEDETLTTALSELYRMSQVAELACLDRDLLAYRAHLAGATIARIASNTELAEADVRQVIYDYAEEPDLDDIDPISRWRFVPLL